MAKIRIDTNAVRVATTQVSAASMIGGLSSALSAAKAVSSPVFSVAHGLLGSFGASERMVREIEGNVTDLARTVKSIADTYEATEKALVNRFNKAGIGGVLRSVASGNSLEVSGAVIGGSTVILGGITASGSLIGGKASLKKEGKWDLAKGEAYTGLSGKAEGWLASGKLSGDYGLAHGEIEGKVGNVSAEGKVQASLFKDGKFDPGLEAKLKGEATALSGKVEGKVGTDYFDVHGKADGKLFTASAEGTLRVDKGGVSVGAKAEAYAATGKVEGGLNLGLFKIDIGLEGKVGGGGVSFGAEADKNSVSGTIGAGLGLGAGLNVKIDWSGAGKFIDDAGTALGEVGAAFSGAAKGMSSFLGNVGSGVSSLWNWH